MPRDSRHSPGGLSMVEAGLKQRRPMPQRPARLKERTNANVVPSALAEEPLSRDSTAPKSLSRDEIIRRALVLAEGEMVALMQRIERVGGIVPSNISNTLVTIREALAVCHVPK